MHTYIGSGPYCYSNSLAMALGEGAPSPSVIEVLTGSPFGAQLISGRLPLFDPYGWDPDLGLDAAIGLLGWTCRREGSEEDAEALEKLRGALAGGPVLAGPVEMGLLLHHPGLGQPIEADHFVLVLAADDDRVLLHDPQGFPYVSLPAKAFLAAWRAETISYKTTRYTMRSAFRREREVTAHDALLASLPAAKRWLAMTGDVDVAPGTLGNAAALERFAGMLDEGADPAVLGLMTHFAVRVGTRRLADAATALGLTEAAATAARQARLVGSLQYELTAGSPATAAATLRELAPSYAELAAAL
ncbi:hypothetical protein [Longispora albida]|uniref:hypothetical protein n=1 Tax=Longispora albida TaxID=203523 RepID=UPI00036DC29F|nr:hypothetical protein [Longispora albida]